ncbi:MAG TPA: DoxX family protein [Candidatus Limnocylindrales bacterium]|nr:DoxX family protein [Candidatus Limnocylindrales bacterium]
MNIALWICQGLLAVIFAVSGAFKISKSKQWLVDNGQTGVVFFPQPAIRAIATLELLGVAGIILPWATGIAPILTPLAASGFALLMVGAAICHTKLREPRNVAINAVIFVIAVFVAYGRFTG